MAKDYPDYPRTYKPSPPPRMSDQEWRRRRERDEFIREGIRAMAGLRPWPKLPGQS